MTIQAAGFIDLTLRAHRERDQFVSECVELGLSSCGDTLDEAFRSIIEATELYLETLEDLGETERVLHERGDGRFQERSCAR